MGPRERCRVGGFVYYDLKRYFCIETGDNCVDVLPNFKIDRGNKSWRYRRLREVNPNKKSMKLSRRLREFCAPNLQPTTSFKPSRTTYFVSETQNFHLRGRSRSILATTRSWRRSLITVKKKCTSMV